MDMGKRIAAARQHLGRCAGVKVSQAKLAELCGWASGQSRIGNYENGGRTPGPGDLEKIADVTGVNLLWLAFGRGDMTAGETGGGYDKHQPRRQGVAELDQPVAYRARPAVDEKVPLISWQQLLDANLPEAGGQGAGAWLYCNSDHSPQTFALRVSGDSMTAPGGRSFPDGALIFVDPGLAGQAQPGDAVVARLRARNVLTFKMLAKDSDQFLLKPLNNQYPMITDDFDIVGKVIEVQLTV